MDLAHLARQLGERLSQPTDELATPHERDQRHDLKELEELAQVV
jgi:hypothetical protein